MMGDSGSGSQSFPSAYPAASESASAFGDNPFASASFTGAPDSFSAQTDSFSAGFSTAADAFPPSDGASSFPPAFPTAEQAAMGATAASLMAQSAPGLNDLAESAENVRANVTNAAKDAMNTVQGMVTGNSTETAPKMQISVTDPVKQGDGFGSYISYKINTKTTLPQYTWKEFSQIHRYSDFVWLHERLKVRFPNVIIPPLPEKAVTGNFDPNFISLRRTALERFLNRIAAHPVLQISEDLQTFLEANEETLTQAKKTVIEPKQKQQQTGLGRWFKEAFQGVSNAVSAPQEFVDPAYEEQKSKIEELKEQVVNLKRYTEKLVMHRRLLSMAHAELGVGFTQYANIEQGHIKNGMGMLGDTADRVSVLEGEQASVEELQLDAMLTDTVLMLGAVGELCQNRAKSIVVLQTSRSIHQEKLRDYERVKGDQRKAAKAAELMREIHEAELQEGDAKNQYDDLVDSMTAELNRFNAEREHDYKSMMLNFAESSREYHAQIANKWDEAYQQLQAEFASTQGMESRSVF
eukprot:TRINITY_DN8705_c0_g3_i1.p1 TRINITY_DN8705_c0_g3~~TRINITY_DN8705_c0_g3_i1.p1  ORF type:complete len:523 (-),score=134.31 TRINITY_DN8705_c0_g3_i1:212-1780(-)